MATLHLPMTEQSLHGAHETHRAAAMQAFDEQHFGRHHAKKSVVQLDEEIDKVSTSPLFKGKKKFLSIAVASISWVVISSIFLNYEGRKGIQIGE